MVDVPQQTESRSIEDAARIVIIARFSSTSTDRSRICEGRVLRGEWRTTSMPVSSAKRESPGFMNAGARPTRNYRATG